jgi:hypothetical protein
MNENTPRSYEAGVEGGCSAQVVTAAIRQSRDGAASARA